MKPALFAVAALSLTCLLALALSSPGAVASTGSPATAVPSPALSDDGATLSGAGYVLVSRVARGEAYRAARFAGDIMSGGAFRLTGQTVADVPTADASGCCCKGYLPCLRK